MKNRKYIIIVAICIGIVTLVLNVLIDTLAIDTFAHLQDLRWALVGIGTGLAGAAISTLLSKKMYKNDPALLKQAKINETDERYIQIRKTAAYYMYFVSTFILFAMVLAFVILNLTVATWIALCALSIQIFLYVYFLFKFNRVM